MERLDTERLFSLFFPLGLLFLSKYISVTKVFPFIFFVRTPSGLGELARGALGQRHGACLA